MAIHIFSLVFARNSNVNKDETIFPVPFKGKKKSEQTNVVSTVGAVRASHNKKSALAGECGASSLHLYLFIYYTLSALIHVFIHIPASGGSVELVATRC